MDELHPEKVSEQRFGQIDECYSLVSEVASTIAVDADDATETSELSRREADELLGYFLKRIATHMETHEAALGAINAAFPDPTDGEVSERE